MSWLPPENEKLITEKITGKIKRNVKVFAAKTSHDAQRGAKRFIGAGHRRRLQILMVPVIFILAVVALIYLPGADKDQNAVKTSMLRVNNLAVSLAFDQDSDGRVISAWVRTPKVSRRIGQLDGLYYIADSKTYYDVDGDEKKDLLWRISFNNEDEKTGVHLWIGILSRLAKIYVSSSPYEYTRWDAVPTKIRIPKDCVLYVSPSIPGTDFRGKDCYSFIYTLKLTPEGLAFVPVPSVYKQLYPILRAAVAAEKEETIHKAYVKMEHEFKKLSEGKIPYAEAFTNLSIDNIDLLPMK